jgi:hypothetical protein
MRKLLNLVVLCAVVVALAGFAEASVPNVGASSHREAPAISQDPAADNTDTYMFRSPDAPGTITLIANYYPYEGPAGGPNFYRFGDDVLYEFHINNNGNAKDQITYQFRFHTTTTNPNTFLYNTGVLSSINDPDWSLRQTYTVRRMKGDGATVLAEGLATPPANVGTHSIPDYTPLRNQAIHTIDGNIKVFAGQRADPFFADVGAIFDLLTIRGGIPAGFSSGGKNTFKNYNLQTIALRIPIEKLTACGCTPGPNDDPVIGFWASASRRTNQVRDSAADASAAEAMSAESWRDSNWRQVSRLGLPLINEVIIPLGLKDKFNASKPVNDVANFAGPVTKPELAGLLHALYGLPVPPTPRTDLVEVLLKGVPGLNRPKGNVVPADLLRLNVKTPLCGTGGAPACSRLGVIGGDVQGFPNGRRLTDDVVDVSERVVAGVLNSSCTTTPCPWQQGANALLGDGVNAPERAPLAMFPYVPDPYDGFTYP